MEITLSAAPDDVLLRAERRRSREAGLLALARLNRVRRDRLFAELDAEWLAGRAAGFLEEVETLVPHSPPPSPGEGETTA
jgi:hypothetical protein